MTMSRRDAVASLALFAELVGSSRLAEARSQTAPTVPPPPVFKHDLPNLAMDDWEVTVSHVDYPPGRSTSPRRLCPRLRPRGRCRHEDLRAR
jgi:hypothetical protein